MVMNLAKNIGFRVAESQFLNTYFIPPVCLTKKYPMLMKAIKYGPNEGIMLRGEKRVINQALSAVRNPDLKDSSNHCLLHIQSPTSPCSQPFFLVVLYLRLRFPG